MTIIVLSVAFLWTLTAAVSLCPFRHHERAEDN